MTADPALEAWRAACAAPHPLLAAVRDFARRNAALVEPGWAGSPADEARAQMGRELLILLSTEPSEETHMHDKPPATATPGNEPDDLDALIREQAAGTPAFATGYIDAQHQARIREFEDLLAAVWLYISWPLVTSQLTTEQRDLFADSIDAHSTRLAATDPHYGEPVKADRWWSK